MDGWMGGWMDEWMDGWMDGWIIHTRMHTWMDGCQLWFGTNHWHVPWHSVSVPWTSKMAWLVKNKCWTLIWLDYCRWRCNRPLVLLFIICQRRMNKGLHVYIAIFLQWKDVIIFNFFSFFFLLKHVALVLRGKISTRVLCPTPSETICTVLNNVNSWVCCPAAAVAVAGRVMWWLCIC